MKIERDPKRVLNTVDVTSALAVLWLFWFVVASVIAVVTVVVDITRLLMLVLNEPLQHTIFTKFLFLMQLIIIFLFKT